MTAPDAEVKRRRTRRDRRVVRIEEILDAAVALVDAEGLSALSMRRLADETGVAPMTIYGFVENKEALLASLGAHVLRELDAPLDASAGWRAQVTHEMSSLRGAIRRHNGLVELLTIGTDAAPVLDELRERLVGILVSTGVDKATVVEALGSLISLTLGFAVGSRARHIGQHDVSYERLRNLDAETFPHLTAVADAYEQHWSDGAFAYGLTAILDSIERARPAAG